MTDRNRVTPFGDIEAFPLRGAFTGNRGILHRDRGIVRFHAHDAWIICSLRFNDRWREQWLPGRFTWLFFHDEAVALAAGHRPCAECRRQSYRMYRDAWATSHGGPAPSAREMNRQLHSERIFRGTHRRRLHPYPWRELPNGAFVALAGAPWLVFEDAVVPWTREGYGNPEGRPHEGEVQTITPPAGLEVLRAGYPVQIDHSAQG